MAPTARALPARWPKVVVAAGRAALAERDGAEDRARARYGEALAIARDMPIPLARSQLLTDYGRFLYRRGEVRQARQTLAEALRLAETCGAAWHAEQARVEWRRAGGRPPGQGREDEQGVRRAAVPDRQHGGNPPAARLRQARHSPPRRADVLPGRVARSHRFP